MSLQPPYEPQAVSELELAFPASVRSLMPDYEDIPEDFRRNRGAARPWISFQQEWFFRGVRVSGVSAKDGVDKTAALRHLTAIQGSFEPRHEHKEAAVAYLASLWLASPPGVPTPGPVADPVHDGYVDRAAEAREDQRDEDGAR